MKTLIFLLTIFVSDCCSGQTLPPGKVPINIDSVLAVNKAANKDVIGQPFPDFVISTGNVQWTNESLKGKIVFINFWFASCPPCIAEFDELNKLYSKFKDDKNFVFISLTFENRESIERIKTQYHISYDVFSITHEACSRLKQHGGFPTTVILDKTGAIIFQESGSSLDKKDIRKHFGKNIYPLIDKRL